MGLKTISLSGPSALREGEAGRRGEGLQVVTSHPPSKNCL